MNTKISLSPRQVKLIEGKLVIQICKQSRHMLSTQYTDCIVASRHMSTIAPKFGIKCVKKVAKPASESQQVNVSTEQSCKTILFYISHIILA